MSVIARHARDASDTATSSAGTEIHPPAGPGTRQGCCSAAPSTYGWASTSPVSPNSSTAAHDSTELAHRMGPTWSPEVVNRVVSQSRRARHDR